MVLITEEMLAASTLGPGMWMLQGGGLGRLALPFTGRSGLLSQWTMTLFRPSLSTAPVVISAVPLLAIIARP